MERKFARGEVRCFQTEREAMSIAELAIVFLRTNPTARHTVHRQPNGFMPCIVVEDVGNDYQTPFHGEVIVTEENEPVGLAFECYTPKCEDGEAEQWTYYFDGVQLAKERGIFPT